MRQVADTERSAALTRLKKYAVREGSFTSDAVRCVTVRLFAACGKNDVLVHSLGS